jgi:hypothetical protein
MDYSKSCRERCNTRFVSTVSEIIERVRANATRKDWSYSPFLRRRVCILNLAADRDKWLSYPEERAPGTHCGDALEKRKI